MKKNRLFKFLFGIAGLLALNSCSLDEYNPSGANADAVYNTEAGMNTLVNATYYNFSTQFYGREDIVFLMEGGSDLWYCAGKGTYADQLLTYSLKLDATVGQVKNTWQRLYEIVNYANAGINRIGNVVYANATTKLAKEGELRFLRAYAYYLIAETYGGVTLRTTETTEQTTYTAQRSSLKEFYELIIGDLEKAVQILPNSQSDIGRADKKAAYGLLARAALTRASYLEYFDNNKTDAAVYYQKALDAAKVLINNQSTYGCSLYSSFEDVFLPANNKNNKEALWVVTHSTNTALNGQSSNPNRLFKWYNSKYTGICGMPSNEVLEYGRDNSRYLMPTKYLLNVFNEDIDSRYYGSFREAQVIPTTASAYKWSATDVATFKKSFAAGAVTLQPGDTASLYTKKVIADKATRRYGVKDINDIYKSDGTITTDASSNIYYPSLRKFRDPNRLLNSDAGTANVIVMRLAEMYLIAAEASMKLNVTTAGQTPADYINVLRTRAAIKTPVNRTADMQVTNGQIDLNFILDERARELCGEHLRWLDLKRTKQLENRLGVGKQNPDIVSFDPTKHYLRPVPQAELDALQNAKEYGQNPGY